VPYYEIKQSCTFGCLCYRYWFSLFWFNFF
jgi:hypothetical protein